MNQSTTHVLIPHDTDTHTSDRTLRQLAGAYIATKASPSTRRAYASDLKLFFRWCRSEGWDPIIGVRRTHLELYARHMEERDLAPKTRHRRIGTVRGWYEHLIDEGLFVDPNPASKVKQPTTSTVRDLTVLTRTQMSLLLKAAKVDSPIAWALVALGFINGLRINEICATDIGDIGQHSYHHVLRIVAKGGETTQVKLDPYVHAACTASADGRDVGPLLMSQPYGRRKTPKRLTRDAAGTILDRLCRTADVPRLTPHGLRRTAITVALQEGVAIREVQLFARHKSIATTVMYDHRNRSMDEHLSSVLIRAVA